MFHENSKAVPCSSWGDDIPISWAKDIVECPPDVTKEQYESVRGLSVLGGVNVETDRDEGETQLSANTDHGVEISHYISTVTTPSHIAFTPYVFFERWCSSASVREYHFHHSLEHRYEQAHHVMRTAMTKDEYIIRSGYGYLNLDYIEIMRLKQLFAYTAPSGYLCDMPGER